MNSKTLLITLSLALVFFGTIPDADARRPGAGKPSGADAMQKAWERHKALEEETLFHGLEWRNIGPVVQGGRVVDIASVPGSPYSFYVAYASGGLWKTTNNGVTFEPVFDTQASIIMGAIAVDPENPQTVWAGTGENNSSRSSYGGMGVFRSDDGGASWRNVGLRESNRIGRIVIDPRDSKRVLVASLGKLYTPGGERGIYLTEDGGESWQQVLAGDAVTGFVDLAITPAKPDVMYAAAWERSRTPWNFVEGGTGSGVWKSTDAGKSWIRLGNGLPSGEHVGRIGLAVSTSHPDTLYASVDNQQELPQEQWDLGDSPLSAKRLKMMGKEEFLSQDPEEIELFIRSNDLDTDLDAEKLIAMIKSDELSIRDLVDELDDANANLFNTDIKGIEVYRSDDGGQSWRKTHDQVLREVVYTYGYYFGEIRVAPDNPDRVFLLGVPLLRSDDGGKSWSGIMGNDMHADLQAMWIDPAYPERVIAGNDGGLDVSYDGGETWLKMDAQPVGQFYTVAVDMADPYNVYGGLQDNGTYRGSSKNRWQDGPSWARVNGGDGMYVAIDPRDNKTVYTGFQFGYYTRIDASGKRHTVRPRDKLGEPALRYNWNTPVVLSTHNPDIVYFGANKLYRSMDKGETWAAISDDLSRSEKRGDVPYATITSISESRLEFGLVWAGTDDGQIQVSDNGGGSWRDVARSIPSNRWVSRVEASGHARNRAYLSLNGYRNDDQRAYVYATDDLGRSWRNISEGLPSEPVNVVREDPVNEDLLYVGTDRGVYVSMDRGASWQALQSGLPNVPVHDLVVHPRERELVAGTHGRSVWIVDVLPVQELTQSVRDSGLHLFALEEIQAQRYWRGRRSLWRHRPEHEPEIKAPYWSANAGEALLEVLDDAGNPVYTETLEARRGVNNWTWRLEMNEQLALEAEQASLAAADSTEDQENTDGTGRRARVAEAVSLGHPLYIFPGDYTIRISRADNSAETKLKVNAPKKLEPRKPAPPPLRGRDK
ncbi:MAG: glycosyl hydrolase [Gammaproteobacteria bacterium]|nr:glycosyl hydrolase [Gammaproteobacteria bacterium]